MAISSVRGKEFYGKIGYGQGRKQEESCDGFSGGLKQEKAQMEETAKSQASVQVGYLSGRVAAELFMQAIGRVNMAALTECSVRRITYQESDYVKVYPTEGYTLKAQVNLETNTVYVEQKNEDGTCQAYEINPFYVSADAKSPVAQAALEAWTKVREEQNDTAVTAASEDTPEEEEGALSLFEKRLLEFQEYVKERLKDGPPKIQIGGAEFSEEEWEKLIRKIDKEIDAYKEELRERIRKQKEADAIKKVSKGSSETTEDAFEAVYGTAQMTGETETERAGEGLILSENETLEGLEDNAPRGSSLLARFTCTKKAPYSYLADESGKIEYKGVTFYCNDKKNQICLGDMSDTKNVINIPLAKGGCLRVNRANIGDLARAISMFSPEDIGRIMRAIAQDNKAKEVEWELEASKGGELES